MAAAPWRAVLASRLGLVLCLVAAVGFPRPADARAGLWARLVPWSRHAQQVRQIRRNARAGHRRERWARLGTRLRHPFCSVQTQRTLLDGRGRPIVDRVTGEARRFDLAVIAPFGRVVELVEVTSRHASKTAQQAKTDRILGRARRRVFIQDQRTGALRRVRTGWLFPTRIRTARPP
jgi:hypothetical protein